MLERPASGRRRRSRVEARTRSGCPTRSRSACGSRASPIQATTSTSRSRRPTCSAASTSSSRPCATLQADRRCRTRSGRSSLPGLMRIARRLQDLAQSDIRRMTRECERVSGINLGQGICDLPTPPLVRDGAIAAIRENRSTYSFAEGARELRDAIAKKLARDNGLGADPASEICVTVGASGAYASAISALLDPGDGILLFQPYYGYHLNAARRHGPERNAGSSNHRAHPCDGALHALQPERQDVLARGAGDRLAGCAEARSAGDHRRDLRVHPLRRPPARFPRVDPGPARAHGQHHGPVEDLQHHRLAARIRRGAGGDDAGDHAGERPVLRLRPDSPAARRRQGIRRAAQLLRRAAVWIPTQARPHLRGPAAGRPAARRSGRRLLRARGLRPAGLSHLARGGNAPPRDHGRRLRAGQRFLPWSRRRAAAPVLLRQGRRRARGGMQEARGAAMRSPLLPIFLVVLVDVLGLTILLPLLPFYAEHFGASPTVVGLLVSTYALCQLVAGPVLGQISDQVGRKPVLAVSQIGTLAGFLVLAFAPNLFFVFLARVIDGLTAGNLSIAQAYIADVTAPKERARAFAVIGIAFGIGFLVGPGASGYLSTHYGYHVPILCAAALSLLSILGTSFLLSATPPRPEGLQPASALQELEAPVAPGGKRLRIFDWGTYVQYFRRPVLGGLLAEFFLFAFAFATFTAGFALFAERRFTWHGVPFGPKEVGYVFMYSGLLGILLQGAMGPGG